MTANELMIGDWLLFYDEDESQNIPVKIVGIDDDDWVFYEFPDGIKEEGWCKKLYFIPLTPEIFEKNGFNTQQSKGEWSPSIDGFSFDNSWVGDELKWKKIPIKYVHELQHALRLCGIGKEIIL